MASSPWTGERKCGVLTLAPPHRPPLTCRSYDALAPIIHEFTYEAMVYDLLGGSMEDNVYK